MSAADKAWRTVGFVGEVSAVMVAGLFELLSPRDKSGEHFAGAAASLADENDSLGVLLRPSVREGKQEPVSGDACCNASDPHTTSQPSPVTTRTSAGDNSSAAAGNLPPTAAAEPLTWLGWAVPAILDVLAEHHLHREKSGQQVCLCDLRTLDHPDDWREHVAPLIAERIGCDPERAEAALGAGYEFVTGVEAAANIVATAAVKQSHKAINSPHLIDGMDMASALDRLTAELRTHADEYRPK